MTRRSAVLRFAATTIAGAGAALALMAAHGACGEGPAPSTAMADTGATNGVVRSRRDAAPLQDGGDLDGGASTTDGSGAEAMLLGGQWRSVSAAAPCRLFEAVIPPDPFPGRTWTSCGTGCMVGAAWPISGGSASVVQSGGAYINGDSYLILLILLEDGRELATIVRMSDGTTVAAAQLDPVNFDCVFGGGSEDAPLLLAVFRTDGGAFFGRAKPEPGAPVDWQSSWVWNGPSIWLAHFMFDNGHGLNDNGGGVYWLPSSSATAFTVLDHSISPVDYASGRGHLLVWNKNDGDHGWIMSFMGDAGAAAHLLDEASGTWINVARTTDDRVVWLSVAGPQALQFVYASAAINWMRYPVPGGSPPSRGGPATPIPAATGLGELSAGGDYAATMGCDANPDTTQRVCRVYVAQLSTQKVWVLPNRSGAVFRSVLAVGPTEIILSEQDPQPLYALTQFKRIVRLEIAHLDEIVASW